MGSPAEFAGWVVAVEAFSVVASLVEQAERATKSRDSDSEQDAAGHGEPFGQRDWSG